ncbi:MAG: hypothetical protein K6T31_08485, partial [Alicyclobacillus sp.]|nr:hypothetical protein [Alicyclobacillus sp.]
MQTPTFLYRFREPIATPESRGAQPPRYSRRVENGVLIETDVPVMMRDGVRIYVDVFRPVEETPVPPLLAWSPYGKHLTTAHTLGGSYATSGVDLQALSPYTVFEAPDPLYWVPRGYAVVVANIRGTWYSEGNATYVTP